MAYHGEERRRMERLGMTTHCPVAFTYNGMDHCALMVNLSEHGARFRLEEYHDHLDLAPDSVVDFSIHTPYGSAACSGKVVWAKHIDEHYYWGIEFTDLAADPKDPLRALMDSVF